MLTLLLSLIALAAEPGEGPPPEALAACAEAVEGDACTIETPRGDLIDGQCKGPPRGGDGPLACVPEGRRPPPPRDR